MPNPESQFGASSLGNISAGEAAKHADNWAAL
jgi:hypothetical protein